MIWIIWLLVIIADAYWNRIKINKGLHIFHGFEGLYRAIAGIGLALCFGLQHQTWKVELMYVLGTFFEAWLFYNLFLNWFRHLPFDHLGNNILDKVEAKAPTFVDWIKLVCTAAFIYGFYHTDLL